MQMIHSRALPFLDAETLTPRQAREALFRDRHNGFILYLSDGTDVPGMEERIIRLEPREALIWLNETPEEAGAFWD